MNSKITKLPEMKSAERNLSTTKVRYEEALVKRDKYLVRSRVDDTFDSENAE